MIWSQKNHAAIALEPKADRYDTNPATDIFNLGLYRRATFLLSEGAGGTGTVKIQVEACTNNAGSGNEAIPFKVRASTGTELGGTLTDVAATGYTTIAGANKMVAVEVDAADLPETKPWVRLQLTEVVNDPCAAGVDVILSDPRYAQESMPSAT